MTVIPGQLQLDLDAAQNGNGSLDHDEMLAHLRAAVTEPGMTTEEIDAAVEDALGELGTVRPPEAAMAPRCVCDGGALLIDGLAIARTCARCGREPRP